MPPGSQDYAPFSPRGHEAEFQNALENSGPVGAKYAGLSPEEREAKIQEVTDRLFVPPARKRSPPGRTGGPGEPGDTDGANVKPAISAADQKKAMDRLSGGLPAVPPKEKAEEQEKGEEEAKANIAENNTLASGEGSGRSNDSDNAGEESGISAGGSKESGPNWDEFIEAEINQEDVDGNDVDGNGAEGEGDPSNVDPKNSLSSRGPSKRAGSAGASPDAIANGDHASRKMSTASELQLKNSLSRGLDFKPGRRASEIVSPGLTSKVSFKNAFNAATYRNSFQRRAIDAVCFDQDSRCGDSPASARHKDDRETEKNENGDNETDGATLKNVNDAGAADGDQDKPRKAGIAATVRASTPATFTRVSQHLRHLHAKPALAKRAQMVHAITEMDLLFQHQRQHEDKLRSENSALLHHLPAALAAVVRKERAALKDTVLKSANGYLSQRERLLRRKLKIHHKLEQLKFESTDPAQVAKMMKYKQDQEKVQEHERAMLEKELLDHAENTREEAIELTLGKDEHNAFLAHEQDVEQYIVKHDPLLSAGGGHTAPTGMDSAGVGSTPLLEQGKLFLMDEEKTGREQLQQASTAGGGASSPAASSKTVTDTPKKKLNKKSIYTVTVGRGSNHGLAGAGKQAGAKGVSGGTKMKKRLSSGTGTKVRSSKTKDRTSALGLSKELQPILEGEHGSPAPAQLKSKVKGRKSRKSTTTSALKNKTSSSSASAANAAQLHYPEQSARAFDSDASATEFEDEESSSNLGTSTTSTSKVDFNISSYRFAPPRRVVSTLCTVDATRSSSVPRTIRFVEPDNGSNGSSSFFFVPESASMASMGGIMDGAAATVKKMSEAKNEDTEEEDPRNRRSTTSQDAPDAGLDEVEQDEQEDVDGEKDTNSKSQSPNRKSTGRKSTGKRKNGTKKGRVNARGRSLFPSAAATFSPSNTSSRSARARSFSRSYGAKSPLNEPPMSAFLFGQVRLSPLGEWVDARQVRIDEMRELKKRSVSAFLSTRYTEMDGGVCGLHELAKKISILEPRAKSMDTRLLKLEAQQMGLMQRRDRLFRDATDSERSRCLHRLSKLELHWFKEIERLENTGY
ncbi:unnamed protein product [Amoebophrya sp. A25]|nr:unnamed protein product [Amoebophrya sp. A25]|eukprot:GSA25T00001318001.1